MQLNPLTLLRLVQALLALLTLILAAIPVNFINSHLELPPVPTALVFLTFATVFTLLLALPYLVWAPRYFPSITHRYVSLAIEFITMIFWFAGFVSSAVFIGKLGFCRGSVCGSLKAAVVLGAFGWVSWCISLVFPIKYCFFEREPEMIAMSGGANLVKESDASKWRLRREAQKKELDVGDTGDTQRSSFDDDDADLGFVERGVLRLQRMIAKRTARGSTRSRGTMHTGDEVGERGFHRSSIGEPYTPGSSVRHPNV